MQPDLATKMNHFPFKSNAGFQYSMSSESIGCDTKIRHKMCRYVAELHFYKNRTEEKEKSNFT